MNYTAIMLHKKRDTIMKKEAIDFTEEIPKQLEKQNKSSHTHIDKTTFRASSSGYCERQILTSKLGIEEYDPETLGRFEVGNWIHEWIQETILPKYPTTHELELKERFEEIGITVIGHYDCFDGKQVYDFKSRSSWYKFNPPIERHIDQLNIYMYCLDVNNGKMVYVSKSDLSTKQYGYEYSEKRLKKVLKKFKRVKESLEEKGFPTSAEDVEDHFSKCGSCLGCKFEDQKLWNFDHVKKVVG